jgi:DNA-binding CsgD family transcriptional regulator
MSELSAVPYIDDFSVTEKTRSFPIEVFDGFSKEELLTVLLLMHRILNADRKRDVERIVTELPGFFKNAGGAPDVPSDNREERSTLGESPSRSEKTYHVLNYFFSCLSRAQTNIDSANTNRLPRWKHTYYLSSRELTVLHWMKEGKTNWEIARIVGLSERTVRFHVGSIFDKLDVTSRTQAVVCALEAGLIAS